MRRGAYRNMKNIRRAVQTRMQSSVAQDMHVGMGVRWCRPASAKVCSALRSSDKVPLRRDSTASSGCLMLQEHAAERQANPTGRAWGTPAGRARGCGGAERRAGQRSNIMMAAAPVSRGGACQPQSCSAHTHFARHLKFVHSGPPLQDARKSARCRTARCSLHGLSYKSAIDNPVKAFMQETRARARRCRTARCSLHARIVLKRS